MTGGTSQKIAMMFIIVPRVQCNQIDKKKYVNHAFLENISHLRIKHLVYLVITVEIKMLWVPTNVNVTLQENISMQKSHITA